MSALHTALRCLGHPASLLSIGLLLLNDHVLKAVAPSWLTGKLSDFAGLFFFPFVLALLVSLILDRFCVPPHRTGRLAFSITAIWFALIKTLPPASALTEDLVSRIAGADARIVVDPTDLVALVALWPAWRLWTQADRRVGLDWKNWAALGMASLATMATSYPPVYNVERIAVVDGQLHVGYTNSGRGERAVAWSEDGGQTWMLDDDPKPSVIQVVNHSVEFPLVVCDPSDASVCYRTAGREQVERSTDAGHTWWVDWSVPASRRAYMDRFAKSDGTTPIDMGPYDMAFFDRNGTHSLAVAMGNEGILVRSPDGSWQRHAMLSAVPTPFYADGFGEAISAVMTETEVWLLIGLVPLIVFSFRSWWIVLDRLKVPREDDRRRRAMRPGRFAVGWTISWLFLFILRQTGFTGFELMFGSLFNILQPGMLLWPIALVLPIGLIMAWRRVAELTGAAGRVRKMAAWCLWAALGTSLLGWMPFLLWTLGTIPLYEIALLLSFIITTAVLYGGNRAVTRLSMAGAPPIGDGTP